MTMREEPEPMDAKIPRGDVTVKGEGDKVWRVWAEAANDLLWIADGVTARAVALEDLEYPTYPQLYLS